MGWVIRWNPIRLTPVAKGTNERENANILHCCLPTCPNDWFSPLQLRKKKRIIHSLHNILEVRQECQFRILKKFLRYMYHSGLVKVLSLQIFKMNQIPIFIMGWIIWWDPKTLTPHAKFCPLPSIFYSYFLNQYIRYFFQHPIINWNLVLFF